MKRTNTYSYIGVAIFISIFGGSIFFVTSLIESCNSGGFYEAGSGVGSLVDIDKEKYQTEFLEKYTDSFFKIYPEYKPTQVDLANSLISDSSVFKPAIFHFLNPNESYCIQWSGTGFISIRYAYDYDRNELIIENTKADATVADPEKLRIEQRFRSEVLNRIDSLISKSKDSTIAIWKASF